MVENQTFRVAVLKNGMIAEGIARYLQHFMREGFEFIPVYTAEHLAEIHQQTPIDFLITGLHRVNWAGAIEIVGKAMTIIYALNDIREPGHATDDVTFINATNNDYNAVAHELRKKAGLR